MFSTYLVFHPPRARRTSYLVFHPPRAGVFSAKPTPLQDLHAHHHDSRCARLPRGSALPLSRGSNQVPREAIFNYQSSPSTPISPSLAFADSRRATPTCRATPASAELLRPPPHQLSRIRIPRETHIKTPRSHSPPWSLRIPLPPANTSNRSWGVIVIFRVRSYSPNPISPSEARRELSPIKLRQSKHDNSGSGPC